MLLGLDLIGLNLGDPHRMRLHQLGNVRAGVRRDCEGIGDCFRFLPLRTKRPKLSDSTTTAQRDRVVLGTNVVDDDEHLIDH